MFINRIVIRNYRNFKLLDIPLNDGVSGIIGENNTGKTNLLRAIRLPLDVNLSSQYRSLTEQDFHSDLAFSEPQQIVISLEFTAFEGRENEEALVAPWLVSKSLARLTYRFRPNKKARDEMEEDDKDPSTLTIQDDYGWEITGGGEIDPATIQWHEDSGSSVRFYDLQSFHVILLDALRDVQQDLKQIRTSPLGRLLNVSNIPEEEKNKLIDALEEANETIADSTSIKETGDAIEKAFEEISGEAFAMEVRLGLADPSFTAITRSLTVLLSDDALDDFEPYRNGLGLNNILYISMVLKYFQQRIATAKTAGQLLLIEEPESHIHPQLQRVLCGTLSKKPFQTILTTHSTHISSFIPSKSCVVLTKGAGADISSEVPAINPALTKKERADLERYLDATKSAILFARKVMLVEGPAELFLIPVLAKSLLKRDFDRLGISVIPIYGVHFNVYAKLFGPKGMPKKCAIVADGDLHPSDALETEDIDEEPFDAESLEELENEYVKVFKCPTTFERALTITKLLPVLAKAIAELGGTSTAKLIIETSSSINSGKLDGEAKKKALGLLRKKVLSFATKVGKARFAQVASKHVGLGSGVPKYIAEAVDWLTTE